MFGKGLRGLTACMALTATVAAGVGVDSDQDGVDDDVDSCCLTPPGLTVDGMGRPLGDLDGDCDVDLEDHAVLPLTFPILPEFAKLQNNFTDTLEGDGPCCAAALAPLDDGTGLPAGGIPDIIISEIKPGEYIEVYNTTGNAVDLSTVAWRWCAPFQYAPVATAVSVPAGGFATLGWPSPAMTNPTETDGEVILFKDSSFSRDSSVLDFVCWGSPSPSRRLTQGAGSGKWSGSCAPSIPPGGAIHRLADADGTSAASYDVTATPSPMNCTP